MLACSLSTPPPPSGLGGASVFFIPQYNFQTLLAPLVYTNCSEPSPLRLWEYSLLLVSSWLPCFLDPFRVPFPHQPFTRGIPWFGPYSLSLDTLSLKFLIQFHSESKSLCWSVTSNSLPPPWTVARQAPVHGISQARILEWAATSSSRGSSRPRNHTPISCIACRFFTI